MAARRRLRNGSRSRRRGRSRSSSAPPPSPPSLPQADALAAVADLVAAGVPRQHAADVVARLTGVARNRLYRGSL